MKLVIRSVYVNDANGVLNLRLWEPEDSKAVMKIIAIDICEKGQKGSDTFYLKVATAEGLKLCDANDGILADRAILILSAYDFDVVWHWLEKTVESCEDVNWTASVEKLRRYFNWEFDNYRIR